MDRSRFSSISIVRAAVRDSLHRLEKRMDIGSPGRALALLGVAVSLVGCVNDGASWMIEGKTFALSMVRQQRYFWQKDANAQLVMARLPDCHRRGDIGRLPIGNTRVEIYHAPGGVYAEDILIAKTATGAYALSLDNCEIQAFTSAPKLGTLAGAFEDKGKELAFVPAPGKQSSVR